MVGEGAEWSMSDHILAAILDSLNAANWQRGGGKGQRPKPMQRPGSTKKKTYGGTPMSLEEAKRVFAREEVDDG